MLFEDSVGLRVLFVNHDCEVHEIAFIAMKAPESIRNDDLKVLTFSGARESTNLKLTPLNKIPVHAPGISRISNSLCRLHICLFHVRFIWDDN